MSSNKLSPSYKFNLYILLISNICLVIKTFFLFNSHIYNIFSRICCLRESLSRIMSFNVSISLKYTAIGKLPIPVAGSNHFKSLLIHTSFGKLSSISLTKIIDVNTSPNCFFSISFGLKL